MANISGLPRQPSSGLTKTSKVYVSLTTSPKRLPHILLILRMLDLESVETIFLCLPERYRGKEAYTIPEALANFPKLKILREAQDLGPVMKLLPAAKHLRAMDAYGAFLITIDDDILYPRELIGQLIQASLAAGGKKVFAGTIISLEQLGIDKTDWPSSSSSPAILEGYAGVLYPLEFINIPLIQTLSQLSLACYTSDDMVISYALASAGHIYEAISSSGVRVLDYGEENDALHRAQGTLQVKTRYRQSLKDMKAYMSLKQGDLPLGQTKMEI